MSMYDREGTTRLRVEGCEPYCSEWEKSKMYNQTATKDLFHAIGSIGPKKIASMIQTYHADPNASFPINLEGKMRNMVERSIFYRDEKAVNALFANGARSTASRGRASLLSQAADRLREACGYEQRSAMFKVIDALCKNGCKTTTQEISKVIRKDEFVSMYGVGYTDGLFIGVLMMVQKGALDPMEKNEKGETLFDVYDSFCDPNELFDPKKERVEKLKKAYHSYCVRNPQPCVKVVDYKERPFPAVSIEHGVA